MKIRLLLVVMLLIASNCLAADTATIEVRGKVSDGSSTVMDTGLITKTFTANARQQQTVNLTANAFTNIAVPNTADAVLIDIGTNRSLTLRAVTGATGISLDSACPIMFPVSADNVTFGLFNANTSNVQVRVYWF